MAGRLLDTIKRNWNVELVLPKFPRLLPEKAKHAAGKEYERSLTLFDLVTMLAAVLFLIAALVLPLGKLVRAVLIVLSLLLSGSAVILRIPRAVLARQIPYEDLLFLLGLILLASLGHPVAAAFCAVFVRIGELAEAYVVARKNAAILRLQDGLPEKARVETAGEPVIRSPEKVEIDEVVLVEKDEIIPLDGVILEGVTELDASVLSGSMETYTVGPGSSVLSGTVNKGAPIRMRVTRGFEESAAVKLLNSTQVRIAERTQKEILAADVSRWFAIAMGVLAFIFGIIVPIFAGNWIAWLTRAAVVLLLSSPAALAISVPLAYLGAVLTAGRQGILAKDHRSFDAFARVNTVVFGKTGTITEANFAITEVFPVKVSEERLLAVAAAAESHSNHPIAEMLKKAAGWLPEDSEGVIEVEEIPGRGVSAFMQGRHVCVGNGSLMEQHGVAYQVPLRKGAAIHVSVDGVYWGYIMVADKVRDGAFDALESLRSQGVTSLVMLTGDVRSEARPIAMALNFDSLKTELTPEEKVSAVRYLKNSQGERCTLAYVGDGINDAAMLREADVGIAINAIRAWEEADAADLVLSDGEISRLPLAKRISGLSSRIAAENLYGTLGMKLLLLVLTLTGVAPAPAAVGLDALFTVLVMANALRAYLVEKRRA